MFLIIAVGCEKWAFDLRCKVPDVAAKDESLLSRCVVRRSPPEREADPSSVSLEKTLQLPHVKLDTNQAADGK